MLITETDRRLYNFLTKYNLFITANQAARFMYKGNAKPSSNLLRSQRRLKNLVDKKYLKRHTTETGNEYIYYASQKPPRIIAHKYNIMEFIINLSMIEGLKIVHLDTEYKDLEENYHIRPDLYIWYEYNGKEGFIFVEVDITKPFTHMDEYKEFLEYNPEYKNQMKVVSVCDTPLKKNDIGVIWFDLSFCNFEEIIKYL